MPILSFVNAKEYKLILYVEPNKKRIYEWLLALRLQLPSAIAIHDPATNVHYSNEKINQKNSDIDNNNKIDANIEPTKIST
ncbi:MAG: hypothetical protein FWE57_03180 [Chitinispirillia bacterium]|nr:hypothetical protein [Chitinispirillia bacterium]